MFQPPRTMVMKKVVRQLFHMQLHGSHGHMVLHGKKYLLGYIALHCYHRRHHHRLNHCGSRRHNKVLP